MLKLTSNEIKFIPDVTFGDVANRDAPKEDQIVVELRIASKAEKSRYLGSSFDITSETGEKKKGYIEWAYNDAVRGNVISVSNVQEKSIDGRELVDLAAKYQEPGEIVEECFLKICGIHKDDEAKKKD